MAQLFVSVFRKMAHLYISVYMTSKTGTLITPLPASIYDLYEKLYSVGIKRSPAEVYLDDRNTLQDANLLIYRVENASADIKSQLHAKILNDHYVGVEDAIQDIEKMTYDSGPIKAVFYCPLTGNIDEGEGDLYTVGNSYLRDYVSFWHGGNDYSVMTHEELDEYIENQGMMIGGM